MPYSELVDMSAPLYLVMSAKCVPLQNVVELAFAAD
jgi:hypothetical protein